jgi:hypothetical protein
VSSFGCDFRKAFGTAFMMKDESNSNAKRPRKRRTAAHIHKEPVIRFQVELLERRLERVRIMMAKAGIRTKRELFDHALSVFEWAVKEASDGGFVGVVKNGVFRTLETPSLMNVQGYAEKQTPRKEVNRTPQNVSPDVGSCGATNADNGGEDNSSL